MVVGLTSVDEDVGDGFSRSPSVVNCLESIIASCELFRRGSFFSPLLSRSKNVEVRSSKVQSGEFFFPPLPLLYIVFDETTEGTHGPSR
jgi:hypothetical protein